MRSYPCSIFRGGTSKGLFFIATDLPVNDIDARNKLLLAAMGTPHPMQIDGLGGAHPLTSKVALIAPSSRKGANIDYTFLQLGVDKALVSDTQNCGNILAAVAPFAIENKLVEACNGSTLVTVHMVNSGAMAKVKVETPQGKVNYSGNARIDGAPGTAAPVMIEFLETEGSTCGALFPTGRLIDYIEDTAVTCIDNGMPLVLLNAQDFGISGEEAPETLENNAQLKEKIEAIRLVAGKMMNLDDVSDKTIPKMCLLSKSQQFTVNTRCFIPHRVHEAIGVLGSVSVASACLIPQTITYELANSSSKENSQTLSIGHPTGSFDVEIEFQEEADCVGKIKITRAALLRTARLLMRGEVFIDE